jgi:hypothetical protein
LRIKFASQFATNFAGENLRSKFASPPLRANLLAILLSHLHIQFARCFDRIPLPDKFGGKTVGKPRTKPRSKSGRQAGNKQWSKTGRQLPGQP